MDTLVLLQKGLHGSAVMWLPLHVPAMNQGIDIQDHKGKGEVYCYIVDGTEAGVGHYNQRGKVLF